MDILWNVKIHVGTEELHLETQGGGASLWMRGLKWEDFY